MKHKKLIIVEKKEIAKKLSSIFEGTVSEKRNFYFKDDITFFYTTGHFFNLQEIKRRWDIEGIKEILKGKIESLPKDESPLRILKKMVPSFDEVILATDYDNEGEVIGRDLLEHIGVTNFKRWKFSSLLKKELTMTYNKLLDKEKTNSLYYQGLSRRKIDFIDGACGTKLINLKKIKEGGLFLTTGRVKFSIIELINNKQIEIEDSLMNPRYETYYKLKVGEIMLSTRENKKDVKEGLTPIVWTKKLKKVTYTPPLPYNTEKLIQTLSKTFSLSLIKTCLEKLYLLGHITYPRTDSSFFQNDFYENAKLKFPELEIISRVDFEKISVGDKTVDHPAISFNCITEEVPEELTFFYNFLIKILVEPLLPKKTREVPYLEIKAGEDLSFTTERIQLAQLLLKQMEIKKEKRKVIISLYQVNEILKEMSKNKIGTKSTQIPILLDLEKKKYYRLGGNREIIPYMFIIKELFRRKDKIQNKDLFFSIEYCKEIQSQIENIEQENDYTNLISKTIDKWEKLIFSL